MRQGLVVQRDPSKLGGLDLPNLLGDRVVGSGPVHLAQVHGGVLHEVEVLAGVPPVQAFLDPPAPPVVDLVTMGLFLQTWWERNEPLVGPTGTP